MAQEITGPFGGLNVAESDGEQTAADQTTTSSTLNFVRPRSTFDVLIYQKTFTSGTGTAGPQFEFQVADDSAFTTNLRRIGLRTMSRASRTSELFRCVAPDGAKQYGRVVPTMSGTDATNYDVKVRAS